MNKISEMMIKRVVVAMVFMVTLLASCTNLTYPTTVCHATDDTANPYSGITINTADELLAHRAHTNDIFPMPAGGCPTAPVVINNGKITICHATSSDKNPFNEITISVNGLNGHDKHEGDIIPMPAGGCPTTSGNEKDNKGQGKK